MPEYPATAAARAKVARTIVTIAPGATPSDVPAVDLKTCHISKNKGEEIEWKLKGPGHFSVLFKGPSPFVSDQFSCGNPGSGSIIANAGSTPFKYEVSVNGGPVLDPDVIVDQ
jgi:hypothetical protein